MQAGILKNGSVFRKCTHSLLFVVIEHVPGWDGSSPKRRVRSSADHAPPRPPSFSSLSERWCVTNFAPALLQNVEFRIKLAASRPRRLPLRPHVRRWVTFLRLFDDLELSAFVHLVAGETSTWHSRTSVHSSWTCAATTPQPAPFTVLSVVCCM